jgi:hypothetical protein
VCITPCHSDDECGYPEDLCSINRCSNGLCSTASVDCAPGYVCCGGGQCCPACVTDADCGIAIGDACISNMCLDGTCASAIIDCLPGYVCCGSGNCCPAPCTTDEACPSFDPCTTGFCGPAGVCEFAAIDFCVPEVVPPIELPPLPG